MDFFFPLPVPQLVDKIPVVIRNITTEVLRLSVKLWERICVVFSTDLAVTEGNQASSNFPLIKNYSASFSSVPCCPS